MTLCSMVGLPAMVTALCIIQPSRSMNLLRGTHSMHYLYHHGLNEKKWNTSKLANWPCLALQSRIVLHVNRWRGWVSQRLKPHPTCSEQLCKSKRIADKNAEKKMPINDENFTARWMRYCKRLIPANMYTCVQYVRLWQRKMGCQIHLILMGLQSTDIFLHT